MLFDSERQLLVTLILELNRGSNYNHSNVGLYYDIMLFDSEIRLLKIVVTGESISFNKVQ